MVSADIILSEENWNISVKGNFLSFKYSFVLFIV